MSDELLPVDDQIATFKRAIEAIVIVAHDPVEPELLAQLLEQPVALVERWCEELKAEYSTDRRGFELIARRRRVPLPVALRADSLRRALRAPRPEGPPVGCRARNAGDRRLQAADLEGSGRLDPGRRPRRCDPHPAGSRLHRRGRSRRRTRTGDPVRHDAASSWRSSDSTPSTICRRSPSSSPTPMSSRRSSTASASARTTPPACPTSPPVRTP